MRKSSKLLLIIITSLMITMIWSCDKKDESDKIETDIPIVDNDAYHNFKLTSVLNTIPYTITSYEEMYDSNYGQYHVKVFDSKSAMVWALTWRDLSKNDGNFNPRRLIVDDRMYIAVQGIISVHNLLTGEFLWEVETNSLTSGFSIYNNILYVLNYNENLVSTFDISNGAYISDWNGEYQNISGINVENEEIILYYKSNMANEDNAYLFDLEWNFDKKVQYASKDVTKAVWDFAESSDENPSAEFAIDGSLDTKWSESVKGYGEKEWLEIKKNLPTLVTQLVIYNGNHTSAKAFEENAKVKRASISVGDNKSFDYVFEEFLFNQASIIEFIRPITADYLFFEIVEAEPGTLYKNTTITEVYTQ